MRARTFQRTSILMLTALLCSVFVQIGTSPQQTPPIFNSGNINYENYLVTTKVGFENPEDFERPEDPTTGYVFAGQTSWSATELNNENGARVVEPATDIVHSGSQSMKLQLAGPFESDKDRRIHIYHQWETATYKHMWFECWYYIPLDFVVDDWTMIHSALSERWYSDPISGYHHFGIGLSLSDYYESKVSETEYKLETILNWGRVDNNGDGVNDIGTPEWKYTNGTIKFGEWTKITTYLYRDIDPTKGIYKCWINDVLQFDFRCRTVGILPEIVDSLPKTGAGQRAWAESGLALYSGDLPNVTPKEIRVDDVIFKHEIVQE